MKRQAHLDTERPLHLWAIVDEAVLHRTVGGSGAMRRQLRHLIRKAELPNVTLQVVPFTAGAHPGMMGAFLIIDFPEADYPSVVCIENGAGNLFLENRDEIRRYESMYEHLQEKALSPEESVTLITDVARGLE